MKKRLQIDGETYQNGDVLILKLNYLETYQIEHTVDMTGTLIVSSSPIAVFSGNDCNPVTRQNVCDHMFEELPPTSSIDTAYVVTPHMHSDTKIRIMQRSFLLFSTIVHINLSVSYIIVWNMSILLFRATNHVILNQVNRSWLRVSDYPLHLKTWANCQCQSYPESTITKITTK